MVSNADRSFIKAFLTVFIFHYKVCFFGILESIIYQWLNRNIGSISWNEAFGLDNVAKKFTLMKIICFTVSSLICLGILKSFNISLNIFLILAAMGEILFFFELFNVQILISSLLKIFTAISSPLVVSVSFGARAIKWISYHIINLKEKIVNYPKKIIIKKPHITSSSGAAGLASGALAPESQTQTSDTDSRQNSPRAGQRRRPASSASAFVADLDKAAKVADIEATNSARVLLDKSSKLTKAVKDRDIDNSAKTNDGSAQKAANNVTSAATVCACAGSTSANSSMAKRMSVSLARLAYRDSVNMVNRSSFILDRAREVEKSCADLLDKAEKAKQTDAALRTAKAAIKTKSDMEANKASALISKKSDIYSRENSPSSLSSAAADEVAVQPQTEETEKDFIWGANHIITKIIEDNNNKFTKTLNWINDQVFVYSDGRSNIFVEIFIARASILMDWHGERSWWLNYASRFSTREIRSKILEMEHSIYNNQQDYLDKILAIKEGNKPAIKIFKEFEILTNNYRNKVNKEINVGEQMILKYIKNTNAYNTNGEFKKMVSKDYLDAVILFNKEDAKVKKKFEDTISRAIAALEKKK